MNSSKTFEDIESLQNARATIEALEEKYEKSINLEDKLNLLNSSKEIVDSIRQIKSAEKRMVKRIKGIGILNEFERKKRDGLKGKIKLIIDYLDLENNWYVAKEKTFDALHEVWNDHPIDPEWHIFIAINLIASGIMLAISIPIILGFLCAVTGFRGIQLLSFINQNQKIKKQLEEAGIYDEVVEHLKNRTIYLDNEADSSHKNFLSNEFDYKRK